MTKIIGNTTTTPNPKPDWNQTDPTKADYIKNKPDIESGEGLKSIQLPQDADTFDYTGSSGYKSSLFESGSSGEGSVELSTLGRIQRNHFLNIGNRNVVEDPNNSNEADDGGVIAGYKNYSDSRATSLLGAWNRARSSNQTLISGYRNTAQNAAHAIISGQNNYVKEQSDNATLGYTLVNKWRGALVTGHWNDPDTYSVLNGASPLFVVGNGKLNQTYSWQRILITPSNSPDFPNIETVIAYNEKHKENPLGEDLFYYAESFSFDNLVLDESKVSKDSEGRPFVFRKIYPDRSNAFIVTNNGRAILNRVQPGLGYVNLKENDLLTKEEIEYVFDEKIKSKEFLPTFEVSDDGFWVVDGVKTEYKAVGQDGVPGSDGITPTIEIIDGCWHINGQNTNVKAKGEDGRDGECIDLNIKNGTGENSLTLKQENSVLSYAGSNGYTFPETDIATIGVESANLSTSGHVAANHFLNIGSLNVVKGDLTETDDGGVISGYKNLSLNSRATNISGAWNRAIKSNQSLIGGYRNTVTDGGHVLMSGQNNYTHDGADSTTLGYGLVNQWRCATVVGHYNNPNTYSALGGANPLFVVGNGGFNKVTFKMTKMLVSPENSPAFPDLQTIIAYNEKHKENPFGEDLFYKTNTFSFANLVLDENDIETNSSGKPVVYRRVSENRSNAFVVTNNGRAILERTQPDVVLNDNDLLTKQEINIAIDTIIRETKTEINTTTSTHTVMLANQKALINSNFKSMIQMAYGGIQLNAKESKSLFIKFTNVLDTLHMYLGDIVGTDSTSESREVYDPRSNFEILFFTGNGRVVQKLEKDFTEEGTTDKTSFPDVHITCTKTKYISNGVTTYGYKIEFDNMSSYDKIPYSAYVINEA